MDIFWNYTIHNLLSFSGTTFCFEVFFTKNATSQPVSVDSFKVSVVRLMGSLIVVK